MACGCSRRAKAASRGQVITGYRITAPDGTTIPRADQPPFFSAREAQAEVTSLGGGTVYTEFRKTA